MRSAEKHTILLAVSRILMATPGTLNHSGYKFDDRLEFYGNVEGKKLKLVFEQTNQNLLYKAEGGLAIENGYTAACYVDGMAAFWGADTDLSTIRDTYQQIKNKMATDKDAYFTPEQAYNFLAPVPIGTQIDMPEPDDKLADAWNYDFTGTLVAYERGFAVIRDGDGDHWDIEPHRLVISEDQD